MSSSDVIEPYPQFLNRPIDLVVDERHLQTRISGNEWMDGWRPVLQRILKLHRERPQRIMIAVGGPPGAGKSVYAAQLKWIVEMNIVKGCHCDALSMDGFHYDNVFLREHFRISADGAQIPLAQYKGAPDTYDIAALKKTILAIRNCAADVRWPAYNRELHDIVPGKHLVMPSSNIVVIDGNYMLVDRGPFKGMPALFDLRIYVDSPAAVIISTLMTRHVMSGKDEMMAKEWVKKIDLPNARLAESTKPLADVIVERSSEGEMTGVTWNQAAERKPETV